MRLAVPSSLLQKVAVDRKPPPGNTRALVTFN